MNNDTNVKLKKPGFLRVGERIGKRRTKPVEQLPPAEQAKPTTTQDGGER